MKKLVFLLSLLVILLAACSSSPTKNAQGKWKDEAGAILTIKDHVVKMTDEGFSLEGSIEDDDNHKGLAKITVEGNTAYLKVKGNSIHFLDNPNSKPTKENKLKKID
ncbi:hypothetical protein [Staphylococcus epidermidis]|jgi:ABC-type Fe3+-hydroxamate transport system substrate-binding protein|uniref:hypothetical protein n=1 Tax=Staphylococcus epidermidis TaxID=1282 RepID=UPI002DBAE978|nr:hypothetical protein [Staphylococcus epidermidis]MEB5645480.1 hypothetical protein [Staphylococcus epidermidis]MEB6729643.1 hypothetical protein [Staphylococcus epidermidis]